MDLSTVARSAEASTLQSLTRPHLSPSSPSPASNTTISARATAAAAHTRPTSLLRRPQHRHLTRKCIYLSRELAGVSLPGCRSLPCTRITTTSTRASADLPEQISHLASSSSSPLDAVSSALDSTTFLLRALIESAADAASSAAGSSLHAVQPEQLGALAPPLAVGVGLPCTVMECGDVFHRSTLTPDDNVRLTLGGVALLLLVGTYLWSTPGVAPGFWDMFVLAPLEGFIRKKIDKNDLVMGKKLGEGGFGSVYKAVLKDAPDEELVVKRATDFGAVEIWMNERVRRACPDACASFLYGFLDKSTPREDFWLIWKYEGDSTLAKLMESRDFPYNLEAAVLGEAAAADEPRSVEREVRIIRALMRKILTSLERLHRIGIVHRDVKPQNMIFNDRTGELKIIDLGAAADLRVGINYNPNEFLLDPRYAAPEQYIMSKQTPRAPPPPVAATLSPVLWQLNLPDRFDIYSMGLIFLQMAFPSLRTDGGLVQFNRQLKRCEYDLAAWREAAEKRPSADLARGFEIMDMDGGLGWQLAQSMVRIKPKQRISAGGALAHPFFYPGTLPLLQRVRLTFLRLLYRDNSEIQATLVNYMARSGTPSVGGFTELSLQEFRRNERKKQKPKRTFDRNALALVKKVERKVNSTLNSTFGESAEEIKAKESWWNRWQSEKS